MQPPKTYKINSTKAISETLDGETIIINLETGCYYSLNPAGTILWNVIAEGKSIPGNDPAIGNFINLLIDDNLIVEIESSEKDAADAATFANPMIEKYTDMQEMLLADPVHDVDTAGWPNMKKED